MKIYNNISVQNQKFRKQKIKISPNFILEIEHFVCKHKLSYPHIYSIYAKTQWKFATGKIVESWFPICTIPFHILLVHNVPNQQTLKNTISGFLSRVPYNIKMIIYKYIVRDLRMNKQKYKFHLLDAWRSRYIYCDEMDLEVTDPDDILSFIVDPL